MSSCALCKYRYYWLVKARDGRERLRILRIRRDGEYDRSAPKAARMCAWRLLSVTLLCDSALPFEKIFFLSYQYGPAGGGHFEVPWCQRGVGANQQPVVIWVMRRNTLNKMISPNDRNVQWPLLHVGTNYGVAPMAAS